MSLLDHDDSIRAESFVAAGRQRSGCGCTIERGEVLVELTDGGLHFGTLCARCFAAVGHRIAAGSDDW